MIRTPHWILAIVAVLLLGQPPQAFSQWSATKEVRGMFGNRVLGGPIIPRSNRAMTGIKLGPGGSFVGVSRDPGRVMFPSLPGQTALEGSGRRPLEPFLSPLDMRPVPPLPPLPIQTPQVPQIMPETPAAPPPEIWFRSPGPPASPAAPTAWGRTTPPYPNRPQALRLHPVGGAPAASQRTMPLHSNSPQALRLQPVGLAPSAAPNPIPNPTLSARVTQAFRGRIRGPLTVSFDGATATVRGTVATPDDRSLVGAFLLMEPSISAVKNELGVLPPRYFTSTPAE